MRRTLACSALRPNENFARITCMCRAAYGSGCQQHGMSSVLHLLVPV